MGVGGWLWACVFVLNEGSVGIRMCFYNINANCFVNIYLFSKMSKRPKQFRGWNMHSDDFLLPFMTTSCAWPS